MSKLKEFIHSLLKLSKPEMKIMDLEFGEAYITHCQFIGTLVVLPYDIPGERQFEQHVQVRLRIPHNKKGVSIMKQDLRMELTFEKYWYDKVLSLCAF